MDWVKKHTDTVIVLGAILIFFVWVNFRLGEIEKQLSWISNTITRIETLMVLKRI